MFRHTLVNNFLEYSAQKLAHKVTLIHQGKRFTYQELDKMADRIPCALREKGIMRGDRIAVFMDNSVEALGLAETDALKSQSMKMPYFY